MNIIEVQQQFSQLENALKFDGWLASFNNFSLLKNGLEITFCTLAGGWRIRRIGKVVNLQALNFPLNERELDKIFNIENEINHKN